MVWSTDEEDARMLLNMNVIDNQFILKLNNISLNNTRQILCKLLLCFAKILKIDHSKIAEIWSVKF